MAQGRDGRIHARYTDGKMQILWGKALADFDVDIVRTSRGEHVPCAWVAAPDDAPTRGVTLVVSHGNAIDFAMYVPFARYLRDTLGVNVAAYDYTGYGGATGGPNISGHSRGPPSRGGPPRRRSRRRPATNHPLRTEHRKRAHVSLRRSRRDGRRRGARGGSLDPGRRRRRRGRKKMLATPRASRV